ncbi:MAG TPA: AAA family ATPase, partial [Paludibacter sp.]|nr:AAA family ATPase [Paludibacter sp.]
MRLNSLSILNYKNIREANLVFSPKINCFIGNNGMGKTNILDAIYYLSFCKSHSNSIDSQNILHHSEFFLIQGKYEVGDSVEEIYCGMKHRQKKQFKRNKKEYDRLSDHIGLLPLVLVSPDDSVLISEGSEERRKFIDGVISQYNKSYLNQLL